MKYRSIFNIAGITSILLFMAGCASVGEIGSSQAYQPIAKNTYALPPQGDDIIGHNFTVKTTKGDTLATIAKRYDVGAQELKDANRGIGYRFRAGKTIMIPQAYILPPPKYRKGIVINVAELRLYYFTPDNTVMTFPVALGRQGWSTPLGKTYVYRKQEAPTWNVPKSIRDAYLDKTGKEHPRRIEAGPENPLGNYAIYLHKDGYLIHGTNNDASIGRLVSSGCIRMFNDDVKELFQYVKRGTPVNIIYYPNKAGWRDGKLYLETHTPIRHEQGEYMQNAIDMHQAITETTQERSVHVNQSAIAKVVKRRQGIPTIIGQ